MAKKKTKTGYFTEMWFKEQTQAYQKRWDAAPWHTGRDRVLKRIAQSARPYMSKINTLPEGFLPSVLDQHLGLLSEGYEYQVMDAILDIGDDRYLCRNDRGQEFCIWSKALGECIEDGELSFLTAIIRLLDDADGFEFAIPAITFGPVMAWLALDSSDISQIASELAKDLYKLHGVSAVIKRDPSPFWALWSYSRVPRVMHKTEKMCTCWFEGVFSEDPAPLLKDPWKKEEIGKRVRYKKSGAKIFFEQIVIYDVKTLRGIILTRRPSYLEKLKGELTSVFIPDRDDPFSITPVVEMAYKDILKKKLPFKTWTHAFDQRDDLATDEKITQNPEHTKQIDSLNAAMQELMPHINAGTLPDWNTLAAKHSLAPESIESLKDLYKKYS